MKSVFTLSLLCLLSLSIYAQTNSGKVTNKKGGESSASLLAKINNRFKTYDDGFYKSLEFDGTHLINELQTGIRRIAVSDIEKVSIIGSAVKLICKNDDCVTWNDETVHSSMGFAFNEDDDPQALVAELNALLKSIRSNGSNRSNADRLLTRVNTYFKTFDDGYYGSLSHDREFIYNDMPGSGRRRIPIKDIEMVRITKNSVQFKCRSGKECAIGTDQSSTYDAMGFSSNDDYDADYFSKILRDLLEALQNR